MPSAFSVVALVAAYNEADIIHHVVADLIDQHIDVYFLDDDSTDDTVKIVEPFVGRGVLAIEHLPARAKGADVFDWERILLRKSALAAELDASWFIHHDADEFRESPWAHLSLHDAIRRVDGLGFNAIDFAGLDFWPVDDRFRPGDDVREALTCYTDFASYDRVQIRCWKKTGCAVDLTSSGGHEAKFPDRKVCPVPFVLRHYPIRGQAHGECKVFRERRNRFLDKERARGWHVQYDDVPKDTSFLRDPAGLMPYDADAVRLRLSLRHRDIEALEETLTRTTSESERLRSELDRTQAELASTQREMESKTAYIDAQARALEESTADIARWRHAVESLTQRLDEIQQSLSWRLTSPARSVIRLIRGR